jgi:serine-type D-Ala-D-Ala carboxypeptidase (penicillin-binding protein 5/6)
MKKLWIWCFAFLIFILPFHADAVAAAKPLSIDSEAGILIDAKTGQVLYEKNAREKMYPASITKIVTGIMAIESGRLDEETIVSKHATQVDGTRLYLVAGEKLTIHQLLYGLLMHSGNDAAIVIAEHFAGSEAKFAEQMNAFVWKTIHSKDTHFTNPHGLFDPQHYTTANDMAQLAAYAMKNPIFREIVGTKKYSWHGKGWNTVLVNQNQLLWRYPGTTGLKNGFVNESLNTLVTSAKRGGSEFIAVALKAHGKEKAYSDNTAMLDYAFAHYQTQPLVTKGKTFKTANGDIWAANRDIDYTVKIGEKATYQVDNHGNFVIHANGTDIPVIDALTLKYDPVKAKQIAQAEKMDHAIPMILALLAALSIGLLALRMKFYRIQEEPHLNLLRDKYENYYK